MSQSHYHSYKFTEPFYPPPVVLKKVYGLVKKIYSHETKMAIIHYNFIEHIITLLNQITKT